MPTNKLIYKKHKINKSIKKKELTKSKTKTKINKSKTKTKINKSKKNKLNKSKKNELNKSKNESKNESVLCNLSYSNNIPEKDAIILSCSIFKLNDMYRDMTEYINGLKKIIKWIENDKYKIHLYIYYDHSIENDKLFIDLKLIMDTKKNITTCKYYCE